MSLSLQNPNRGPLKLDHDLTPRDLGQFNTSTDGLIRSQANHGFKGFPVNNFEKSRDPVRLGQSVDREFYYGVPHHLDTRKPLAVGLPQGFKYGSEQTDSNRATNSQPVSRLANKTSAELARFRQQQEEADYNIQQYKRERQQRLTARDEEQRNDMAMLKSYNPWGQPGAGAPMRRNGEHQSKKSRLDDRGVERSRQDDLEAEYGNFHDSFGRPGHGAPLRTDSGKIKTEIKGVADIRFQNTEQGKAIYNQELRYQGEGAKKQQYQQELDFQLKNLKQKAQEERLENIKRELETLHHDPYSKPGAGAPNKTRSDMETKAMNRTNSSVDDKDRKEFELFDPWGKGVGQPRRDQFGDIRRYRYADGVRREVHTEPSPRIPTAEEGGTSLEMTRTRGGAGAPIVTDSGHQVTRKIISMRRNETGDTSIREDMPGYKHKRGPLVDNDPEYAIYDPFGKSGAGAPLKNNQGQVTTNIYGKLRGQAGERTTSATPGKKEAAQQYLNELQHEMTVHRRNKEEFDRDSKTEGDGIADKMHVGQVGKPRRDPRTGLLMNQHLGRTDVTMEQTQERSMKTGQSLEYHTELDKAAEERKRSHALDNLREKQQGSQHQKQMNNFWGRPGGGAPNQSTKKANLEDILYSPRKELNDFYNKNLTSGQNAPQNFIRNTVNSMHENLYEYTAPQRRLPKKDYKLMMPYAVGSEDAF